VSKSDLEQFRFRPEFSSSFFSLQPILPTSFAALLSARTDRSAIGGTGVGAGWLSPRPGGAQMGIGTLLLAGLLLGAEPAPSDVTAVNDRAFLIPVTFTPELKAQVREVILFESTDQGRQWNQRAVNPPTKEGFAVTVPADGWYWYAISTVDQKGERHPSDPSKATRIMKVLVDTKRPDVRLTAARQGEGVVAEWTIQEENPKLATFKLQYRTADMPAGQWQPVKVDAQLTGRVGFNVFGSAAVAVRLEIKDEADNVGTAQAEVASAAAAGGIPLPLGQPGAGPGPDGGSGSPFAAQPVGMARGPTRPLPDTVEPMHQSTTPTIPPPGSTAQGSTASDSGVVAATGSQGPSIGVPPPNTPPPAPVQRGPLPGLEYVNTNRVSINYAVDKIGASGLGSVDLYVTRDDGATWQRLTGEQLTASTDPASPTPTQRSITADLPGEGRYGFYLIVRSGVGLGKQPPRNGDRPQMRVEVDMTPPEGTLYGLQPAQGQPNAVVIRWKASDLNLPQRPIRLEWAERKGGPWQTIGEGDLPNTSYYTWKLPERIPGKVYLKMTITDLAGNTGVAESADPVTIDLTEPEARIISLGPSR
jgi:hypothetical protein